MVSLEAMVNWQVSKDYSDEVWTELLYAWHIRGDVRQVLWLG